MTPLLFDMDGLLLDTERVYLEVAIDLLLPHGVPRDEASAFFLTLVGMAAPLADELIAGFLPSTVSPKDFDKAWGEAVETRLAAGIPLRPGVAEVLPGLKARGHRLAVVTSTRKARALDLLRIAGLLPLFERVTGGDEVSANKPDPAPYRETAQAMGVDPRDCIAFEDSDRGLTAAVRAGCRAVQIPDLRPPCTALPALGQLVARDLLTALDRLGLRPN